MVCGWSIQLIDFYLQHMVSSIMKWTCIVHKRSDLLFGTGRPDRHVKGCNLRDFASNRKQFYRKLSFIFLFCSGLIYRWPFFFHLYKMFQAKSIIMLVLVNINFVSNENQMVTDGYETYSSILSCMLHGCAMRSEEHQPIMQAIMNTTSSCYSPFLFFAVFRAHTFAYSHILTSQSYLIIQQFTIGS